MLSGINCGINYLERKLLSIASFFLVQMSNVELIVAQGLSERCIVCSND